MNFGWTYMFLAVHTCINICRGILDIGFFQSRLLNDEILSALAKYVTSVVRHRNRVNWPLCSAVQPTHWTLHFLLRCQFWRWLLFPSYLLFEYHTKQWWLASTIINTVDPKRRTGYCFNSCFMFPLFFLPNVPACICYHFCRFENFLQSFF